MWVTITMTGCLVTAGTLKFAALFYEALLSSRSRAGFMCVTSVLILSGVFSSDNKACEVQISV